MTRCFPDRPRCRNDRLEPDTWAVVVAAGDGFRFGGRSSSPIWLAARSFQCRSKSARSVANGVVLVIPHGVSETEIEALDPELVRATDAIVRGGATRADSVRAGLSAVPGHAGVIIVHDAARPLASPRAVPIRRDRRARRGRRCDPGSAGPGHPEAGRR